LRWVYRFGAGMERSEIRGCTHKHAFPRVTLRSIRALRLARSGEFVEPDQSDSTCPVPSAKYFRFAPDPNHFTYCRRPVPPEGRLAIVTDAGRDAVDAKVPITNGIAADGEDVWS
jgi:hypothetical protein